MHGNFSMFARAKMLEKMGLKKGWTKKGRHFYGEPERLIWVSQTLKTQ